MQLKDFTTSQIIQLGPFLSSDGDIVANITLTTDDVYISVGGSTFAFKDSGSATSELDGFAQGTFTTVDFGDGTALDALIYVPATVGRMAKQVELVNLQAIVTAVQAGLATTADVDTIIAGQPDSTAAVTTADVDVILAALPDSTAAVTTVDIDVVLAALPDSTAAVTTADIDTILNAMPGTSLLATSADVDTILAALPDSTVMPTTAAYVDAILAGQPDSTVSTAFGIAFADTLSELATAPGNTPTLNDAIMLLYHIAYHGTRQNADEMAVKVSGGELLFGPLTDDGTTFDRGTFSTST